MPELKRTIIAQGENVNLSPAIVSACAEDLVTYCAGFEDNRDDYGCLQVTRTQNSESDTFVSVEFLHENNSCKFSFQCSLFVRLKLSSFFMIWYFCIVADLTHVIFLPHSNECWWPMDLITEKSWVRTVPKRWNTTLSWYLRTLEMITGTTDDVLLLWRVNVRYFQGGNRVNDSDHSTVYF